MNDVTPPQYQPAQGGSVVLMLALNLILLALFILLNAFAKPSHNKSLEAIRGVGEGFDYRESGLGLGSDQTASLGIPWQMNLQEGLNGLVHNQLLLDTDAVEADANVVRVTLPATALFAEDGTDMLLDRLGFVENVAALLAPPGRTAEGVMEVVVAAPLDQQMVAAARMQALMNVLAPPLGEALTTAVRVGEAQVVMEFTYKGAGNSAGRMMDELRPLGGKVEGIKAP